MYTILSVGIFNIYVVCANLALSPRKQFAVSSSFSSLSLLFFFYVFSFCFVSTYLLFVFVFFFRFIYEVRFLGIFSFLLSLTLCVYMYVFAASSKCTGKKSLRLLPFLPSISLFEFCMNVCCTHTHYTRFTLITWCRRKRATTTFFFGFPIVYARVLSCVRLGYMS